MISSKLPHTGTSIFTVMSSLANEYSAINLSQGFPDFPVSEKLVERIHYYMKAGRNQYAPMPGTPELRNEIARVVDETYKRPTDAAEEVTVYAGGTEALFATFTALIHPGDEVIVFDPAYDSYDPVIRLAGATPVHIRLTPPKFGIPWDEVEDNITNKTRAIVINSPQNPTGAIISEEDALAIIQVRKEMSRRHGRYDGGFNISRTSSYLLLPKKLFNPILENNSKLQKDLLNVHPRKIRSLSALHRVH